MLFDYQQMGLLDWLFRTIGWYTKDGPERGFGKVVATLCTFIGGYDLIFGTHYLALMIMFGMLIMVFLVVSVGSLLVKGLDWMGIIDLTPEQEILRKGFGLITAGVEDWIELVVESLFE